MCSGRPLGSSSATGGCRVFLAEFVDAASGVDDFLLARVERMAVRADFHLEVVSQCRTRLEGVAAGAAHIDFFVVRMRIGFHGFLSTERILPAGDGKKGAQSSGPFVGSQAQKPRVRYPQKVWITLWVAAPAPAKSAAKNANPLPWSNNDHDVKAL